MRRARGERAGPLLCRVCANAHLVLIADLHLLKLLEAFRRTLHTRRLRQRGRKEWLVSVVEANGQPRATPEFGAVMRVTAPTIFSFFCSVASCGGCCARDVARRERGKVRE